MRRFRLAATRFLIFGLATFAATQALAQNRVFIDPGHGINGDGSNGDGRTPLEIETNVAVGVMLRQKLMTDAGRDWAVLMSRSDNSAGSNISLAQRVAMSNSFNADCYLSIHSNASPDPAEPGTGTETFWCDLSASGRIEVDRAIAQNVQSKMVEIGEWVDRRVVEDNSFLRFHLAVLRNSEAPAVLNEIGFVDNPSDSAKLESDFWRDRFAQAYLKALQEKIGLDVFFLVDLSGSFADDLPLFKTQAPDIISTLREMKPDSRFGLGEFEDYPIPNFGSAADGDKAYARLVDLTFETTPVLNAIAGLSTRFGDDEPESQLPALFQAATGAGQDLSSLGFSGASIPPNQQANFRDGAIKLFLLWTDASFHRPGDPGEIPYPGPSFSQTVSAILALDPPQVIGISSGGGGLSDLQAIAAATNAVAPPGGVDCNADGSIDIPAGEPLVCSIGFSGQGLSEAIVSLVETAAEPFVLLDIDNNGINDALSDGLLALRFLFGFRGATLTDSAVGNNAERSGSGDIEAYLNSFLDQFDVDGNGQTDALSDGLLILRFLFGFRGQTLIDGVVSADATRTTPADIEAFLISLTS